MVGAAGCPAGTALLPLRGQLAPRLRALPLGGDGSGRVPFPLAGGLSLELARQTARSVNGAAAAFPATSSLLEFAAF